MDIASASLRDFLTSARWYQLLVVLGTLALSCFGIARLVNHDQPLVVLVFFIGILAVPIVLVNPRWGLITFLWLAHTIDAVKRIVYSFTTFSQLEIAKILIVPVLLAGALYIRVFTMSWFGTGLVERVRLIRFWPLVLAIVGALLFTVRGGLTFEALTSNYTLLCYMPAGIIVPHIIFNAERRLAYVKTLLIISFVVGVYGLIQALHGPFDYEVEYMLSGLTLTVSAIEGAYFRAFSLLNNGPTFCGVMIMSTLLSYYYFCRKEKRLRLNRGVVLMTLFTLAVCFSATQRSALMCFVITLCFVPLFTRPRLFFTFLGTGVAAFAFMVVFADDALDSLRDVNESINSATSSAFIQQNANLLTYAQRLNGFSDIKNPALWTPFGSGSRIGQVSISANSIAAGHDLISNFLEWFGYIGTGTFLIFCAAFVYTVIIRVRDLPPERSMWAQCNLAIFLFMMIWQITNGPALHVSPIQFYFWVAIGNVLYLLSEPRQEPESQPAAETRVPEPSLGGLWRPSGVVSDRGLRPS